MAFDFIKPALHARQQQDLLRQRYVLMSNKDCIVDIAGQHYLNFASNDYLGLSQHPQVLQAYVEGLAVYGSGSGASPVVTGYCAEHKALEEDICEFSQQASAILFSSGFAANEAICHALFSSNSLANANLGVSTGIKHTSSTNKTGRIVCDKYMHASFIQGAQQSSATLTRFKHNDLQHAQVLLQKRQNTQAGGYASGCLVATEGVFSMDGDEGKVPELQRLLAQISPSSLHKPWLMIDDAHALGVTGKNGFGTSDREDVNASNIDILMGTFGKALGCHGAFVAGSAELIEYLVNTSKHYIYSTAFSGAQARAIRAALALVEIGEERQKLQQNVDYFCTKATQSGLALLPSKTAIQPLVVGSPGKALAYSQHLADLGLWVPAIRTPTVPKHSDRLRIIITAMHQTKDIDVLIDGLCIGRDKLDD